MAKRSSMRGNSQELGQRQRSSKVGCGAETSKVQRVMRGMAFAGSKAPPRVSGYMKGNVCASDTHASAITRPLSEYALKKWNSQRGGPSNQWISRAQPARGKMPIMEARCGSNWT